MTQSDSETALLRLSIQLPEDSGQEDLSLLSGSLKYSFKHGKLLAKKTRRRKIVLRDEMPLYWSYTLTVDRKIFEDEDMYKEAYRWVTELTDYMKRAHALKRKGDTLTTQKNFCTIEATK